MIVFKVGNMDNGIHQEIPNRLNPCFIRQHAQILKDLGGKLSKNEYVKILSVCETNAEFDALYNHLRREIFDRLDKIK